MAAGYFVESKRFSVFHSKTMKTIPNFSTSWPLRRGLIPYLAEDPKIAYKAQRWSRNHQYGTVVPASVQETAKSDFGGYLLRL